MTTKHLVLGLDGVGLDLVEGFGPSSLPNLHALMQRGIFASADTVKPHATLPNWTTFLTALDPAAHGVFDFTTRDGYRVAFTGGLAREAETWAEQLDREGRSCAIVGFPGTWPPAKLEHGLWISGWDSPVAAQGDASFVWPERYYRDITARFGSLLFDDVNEFQADSLAWLETLSEKLSSRITQKCALGKWVLAERDWDVAAFYFGETDTAAHYLFGAHDPASPRHLQSFGERARSGLRAVYESVDAAVGELLAAAGSDVDVTVVSDHGSGGSSDKVLYINRALAEAGLLHFRRSRAKTRLREFASPHRIRQLALRSLPPAVREGLFKAFGGALPSLLESRVRFGAIDMSQTLAFSDELNYFPAVHLNLRGREPQGVVAQSERAQVEARVEAALKALRDPWTGAPVVEAVHRREDLFSGPYLERAPDLILELALTGASGSAQSGRHARGYSYNVMPSAGAPTAGVWRRLHGQELLGCKGRSLPGSHRPRGIWVAAGPTIHPLGQTQAHIADAAATLLARLGLSVPADSLGRVHWEALRDLEQSTSEAPAAARPADDSRKRAPLPGNPSGNQAHLEARLRALGYVD